MNRLSIIALAIFLAGGTAIAGEPISVTRPAKADGVVKLELVSGSLEVLGWERDEVRISGTLGKGTKGLEVEERAGLIRISVEYEKKGEETGRSGPTRLEVHIPRDSQLEIRAVSAGVKVREVRGVLEVSIVSGDVDLKGSFPRVETESVSGELEVVSDVRLERGTFQSVSGRTVVTADVAPKGKLELESVSGDIELRVPESVSARFDVETFSGHISNDFGTEAERANKYAPGYELNFVAGRGEARVSIESFSGNVKIRKQ